MTLEISPVLAGTYDAPNYAPPNNVASTQVDDAGAIDSRRYTKFDRSATEAGSTTNFSFSDFVDMINPLQHIPVVSSVYREITGESINPVSRVAGDVLFGGVFGIASAVLGIAGGAGDAVMEAQTGKDSIGTIIASLFETDQPASSPSSPAAPATQLAQLDNPAGPGVSPPTTQTAAKINARAKLQAAAVVAATSSAVASSMPSSGVSSPAAQMASASSSAGSGFLGSLTGNPAAGLSPLDGANAYALAPNKLPYGGVMAPPLQGMNLQGSNMAVALANSAPGGLQMNHTVYTGRLMNGVKPSSVPVASATPPSAPPTPTTSGASSEMTYASTSAPDALPPALMSDIAALRAINQYRSTGSQTAPTGASLDVVN